MSINISTCRSCGQTDLKTIINLGRTPLADALLSNDQLGRPESTYPLEVVLCCNCALVQILETVPPEELFCNSYPYYSSFSPALLQHSKDNVLELIKSRDIGSDSFVVELASNDGYLLKNYVKRGIPCLGIDPATGPAQAALEKGVPTLCKFFDRELALLLRDKGKSADIIHANNVLAHVADTNGFVESINLLLKDDGVAIIEVPYIKDLVDHCEFDTIYHEHLCYFSVTSLNNLFNRHLLFINRVQKIPIHGGSLRLFVEKKEATEDSVRLLVTDEKAKGLDKIEYYQDFAVRVMNIKTSLRNLLSALKAEGKSIAAYGAAAKGSTLINYIDIGTEFIDFVVDRNVFKQGKYMPGKHLPIYAPDKLIEDMPDYVMLLAWNFANEIIQQQQEYHRMGGKFIIPIPNPVVV